MNIRLNQVGYYPDASKKAIVVWSKNATIFNVCKVSDSSVVFSGSLSASVYSGNAGDSVKQADFTDLTAPGKYFIIIPGNGTSLSFVISKSALRPVAYGSLKSFYYQRSSFKLDSAFAGVWARSAGHPDTSCIFHSSLGKTGSKPSPGGWYDAGDYGKYVVNAGITVGSLLQIYENFPDYFADSTLIIPESGNGKNDLLDEVKFELNWLKTMQDTDGGVFHKITTLNFPGFVMPVNDNAARYFVGKSTAATLDFAAMMAMAGRIYKNYDSIYASNCITRAEQAWVWAKANPARYFTNPADVSTGEYGNGDVSDEFVWAAAELLITTGKTEYKTYLETRSTTLNYQMPGWPNVSGMASLSLATCTNSLTTEMVTGIRNSIISRANTIITEINSEPYRTSNSGFYWGSNGSFGNYGVCLVYAYLLTKDLKYIKAAAEIADYLLGKNATGFSFFTYYGHKTPMNIHHRPSGSDGVIQPVPGFVVGGPNANRDDRANYAFTQPAKSYTDLLESYASNEVCINWNAPVTVILAAVDDVLGDSAEKINFTPSQQVNNPPSVRLAPGFNSSFKEKQDINITATVVTSVRIQRVELYIDSKYTGELTSEPYQWKINNLTVGTHTIAVNAIDANELVTERAISISITKDTKIPELVQKKNPYQLSVYSNPVDNKSIILYSTPVNGEIVLEVFDYTGKQIAAKKLQAIADTQSMISWQNLNLPARGSYYVVMKQNGIKVASIKVIDINR